MEMVTKVPRRRIWRLDQWQDGIRRRDDETMVHDTRKEMMK